MNNRTVYGGHSKFCFKGTTVCLCATDDLSMCAIGVTHVAFCSSASESHQAENLSVVTSPQSKLLQKLPQLHH